MVSNRVERLIADSPLIAVAHFRAEADPYHAQHNPGGYLNLGTAENRLVWDLLAPRFVECRALTAENTRYASLYGTATLRHEIAAFLSRTRRDRVDPDDLIVVAGATSALDIIATTLCEPGDVIVVPAPYYGAFDVDLAGRSQAQLVPAPMPAGDMFRLSPSALDRTLVQTRAAGMRVRAVALTSPSNPVGHVYPEHLLREVLDVAAGHDVDLISDEIYANSVFGPQPFISIASVADSPLPPDRVHLIWGFAKDFGVPGFKAGVLHTVHPQVRAAARELAYFAPLSTHTQAVLAELLADTAWVEGFIAENRRRLAGSYEGARAVLDAHGIPYAHSQAGFSIWTDLREWLTEPSRDAEWALWQRIQDEVRVSILPGAVFGCPVPGWFRICHTTDPTIVNEALSRVGGLLT